MWNRWTRKLHRTGAVLIALPLLVVISTGILLQLKKQLVWVQPATATGRGGDPRLTMNEVLEVARSVPEASIRSWQDVERFDVRPGNGIVKVRAANHWEVQVDWATGEILSSTYRRSDLIESIHDGSWFSDRAKLWIFLPSGLVLLGLWLTGVYLWALPLVQRRRNRRRRRQRSLPATPPAGNYDR